jgi:hypothetical protein
MMEYLLSANELTEERGAGYQKKKKKSSHVVKGLGFSVLPLP